MKTYAVNGGIGSRLRAERERLGMTQTAMAIEVGVSRATQVNYESGKRLPDIPYVQAVGKLGVDSSYILTGLRTSADSIERRALLKVIDAVCDRLGVDYILPLEAAYEEAAAEAGSPEQYRDKDVPPLLEEVETALFDAITKIELNATLLAEILGAMESIIEMLECELPPVKKADLAVMLYRAFKPVGKVDSALVEQAVKLAIP